MASSIIAQKQLTQTRLRELLYLNESEGKFYWRINRGGVAKAGDLAGGLRGNGYHRITINDRDYPTHLLVFLYVTGEFPKGCIDHINRNRLDNRFDNLRVVTNAENQKNKSRYKNNTSGFNGIYFDKRRNKWQARFRHERKWRHIGSFDSIELAVAARIKVNLDYGFSETHGVMA